jgi:hypothetical protein
MVNSAADERAHCAALAAKAEGNLLTNKTCGTHNEIHRYLLLGGSLRGRAGF